MGYTLTEPECRLICGGKVMKPFRPDRLYVDPCATTNKRYITIDEYTDGTIKTQTFPWHGLITSDDTARVRYLKWCKSKEITALEDRIADLKDELRRLSWPAHGGGHWPHGESKAWEPGTCAL